MGEGLRLQAERVGGEEDDPIWSELHTARPMAERLERAFDAAAFAAALRGVADRA